MLSCYRGPVHVLRMFNSWKEVLGNIAEKRAMKVMSNSYRRRLLGQLSLESNLAALSVGTLTDWIDKLNEQVE